MDISNFNDEFYYGYNPDNITEYENNKELINYEELNDELEIENLNFKDGVTLRKPQRQCINLLLDLEENNYIETDSFKCKTRLAINALFPGAGKTPTMLTLCQYPCSRKVLNTVSDGLIEYIPKRVKKRLPVSLVSTDIDLIYDTWEPNLLKFFKKGAIPYKIFETGKDFDPSLKGRFSSKNPLNISDEEFEKLFEGLTIAFIPCSFLYLLFPYFKRFEFDRLIIDEAQDRVITNGNLIDNKLQFIDRYPFGMIYLTCATPELITKRNDNFIKGIISGSGYLKDINKYEQLVKKFIIKFPRIYVDSHRNMPPLIRRDVKIGKSDIFELFEGIVDDDIMMKIENDDLSGAAFSMGCRHYPNDKFLHIMFEETDRKINRDIKELLLEIEIHKLKDCNKKIIEDKYAKIEELEEKIEELDKRYKRIIENIQDECPICCCDIEGSYCELTCCNKIFHASCITTYFRKCKASCPFCSANVTNKDMIFVSEQNDVITENNVNTNHSESKKLEFDDKKIAVDTILSWNKHKKILFFIDIDNDEEIEKMNFGGNNYLRMFFDKGKYSKQIKQFTENKSPVILFINSKKNASGLDFQMADAMFIYSNYSSIEQIEGRAQREGRKESCTVYTLKTY